MQPFVGRRNSRREGRAEPSGAQSRYVEEVARESDSYQLLMGKWQGEEEEHDGMSLQSERLALNEDGTFTHCLEHRLSLANDRPANMVEEVGESSRRNECESSCSGRWRLFNIRHLGADLSAPANDRELVFERAADSGPLLVDKLIVCGANPTVNGFIGNACRLYPADRSDANRRQSAAAPSQQYELEVEDPEPSEADAKQLAEATGHSVDACLAALFQARGNTEEAAIFLLENPSSSSQTAPESLPSRGATNAAVAEQSSAGGSAEAVAEATGRTLAECAEALRTHGGQVDDAVVYLLGLPEAPVGAEGSGADLPVHRTADSGTDPQQQTAQPSAEAADPNEAVKAARLTEIAGQPFKKCLEILRQHNGNAEAAAATLLGLDEPPPDADTRSRDEVSEDDVRDLGDLDSSAVADMEAQVDAEAESALDGGEATLDPRAVADVEAQVNAEVDTALARDGDAREATSSPSPKRRRIDDGHESGA